MKGFKLSQEAINQMTIEYNNGMTIGMLSQKYGVSRTTVGSMLHYNGVPYRSDRLSKEQEQEICDLYLMHKSQAKVSEIVGASDVTIGRVLRRNNIEIFPNSCPGEKYTLNENYFDAIDTHEKAYIFGLLSSDGFLSEESKHNIGISLQESDLHILEEINRALDSNRPIKFKNMKSKKDSYKNQYQLIITNKHMWETLYSYGVVPNKSMSFQFPKVDDEFLNSYLLGYIDGDGSIDRKNPRIRFLATESFAQSFDALLYNKFGFHCGIYPIASNPITKEIMIYGKKKTPLFLDWLYKDSPICLNRKKKIYLEKYVNNSLTN